MLRSLKGEGSKEISTVESGMNCWVIILVELKRSKFILFISVKGTGEILLSTSSPRNFNCFVFTGAKSVRFEIWTIYR